MRRWCVVFIVACTKPKPDVVTQRLEHAWQGTWVLPLSYDIVDVKGHEATYWDRARGTQVNGTFTIAAPCLAVVETRAYTPPIHFAYDGALLVGAHGVRNGETWYACPLGDVVVEHTGKACKVRHAKQLRCELTATHLDLAFEVDGVPHERRLEIHGNVLWNQGPPQQPYAATSLDDAKLHAREKNLAATPESGERTLQRKGCVACHTLDGTAKIGPTLKGAWGTQVTLADGSQVAYDEAYVRESVRAPAAKARPGFPPTCMQYDETQLTEAELVRIVDYLRELR